MRIYTEWSEFTVKRDTTVATARLYAEWLESAVKKVAQIPTARLHAEWLEVAVSAHGVGGWSVGTIRF